jgi:hypothetical protein
MSATPLHEPQVGGTPRGQRAAAGLRRLPLLLVAAAMLVPLLLSLVLVGGRIAGSHGALAGYLEQLHALPLKGMESRAATPAWSTAKLFSGAWQAEAEAWWNSRLSLRAPIVRATNQAYYSWLDKSHMYAGNIVVGRDQVLFEKTYIQRYCNWDRVAFTASAFDAWAGHIKAMQDLFTGRGQRFVYLISPSKAAFEPHNFPVGTPCPGPHRPEYGLALAALKRAGVRHVDASLLLAREGQRLPAELLFARGGTHWTALGAGLTIQELLRVAAEPPGAPLPELDLRYHVSHESLEQDRDLLNLLNLRHPDAAYPSPVVDMQGRGRGERRPGVAIVGTSFMHEPSLLLGRSGGFSSIDFYYYFSLDHMRFENGQNTVPVGGGKPPGNYLALRAADLVIVEENEAAPNSQHLRLLLENLGLADQGHK